MTEKIGVQAVLEDSQFQSALTRYIGGLDKMVAAGDMAESSAAKQASAYLDLNQTLSNTGPTQLATSAISQLQSQLQAGDITLDQYAASVSQIQEQFGLVTPAGSAAAAGLESLNKAFAAGDISAEEFATELSRLGGDMEDVGDDSLTTAAKIEIFEKALDQIKQLVSTGLELAELGAMSERVEQRFDAFAEAAGGADVILQAFQEGAGGTVSKMDAMSSASRLLQMGLVGDADEMARVVEMATRLGDQTMDATSRVSDFALMLANQSIPRLDNFGISSGKVRARIAELTSGVNAMSRETAFMQATMEAGSKSLGILGERVEDDAMKIEQAKAKFADLRVEMGQKLAPVAGKLAELIGSLDNATISLVIGLTSALGIVAKFSGGLTGLVGKVGNLSTALGTSAVMLAATTAAVIVLVEVYGNLQDKIAEVEVQQQKAIDTGGGLDEKIQALVDSGMSLSEALSKVRVGLDEASDAFYENETATDGIVSAIFKTGDAYRDVMLTSMDAVSAAIIENTSGYEEYIDVLTTWNLTATDGQQVAQAMTKAQYELATGQGYVAQSILRLYEAQLDATDASEEGLRAQQDVILSSRDEILALEGLTNAEVGSAEARGAAARKARELADATAAEREQTQLANAAIEEARGRYETLREKQREAEAAARDHAVALGELSERLMDIDAAGRAAIAIDNLTQMLNAGKISEAQYRAETKEIRLEFGLATEESYAFATGMTTLDDAVERGIIPVTNYNEAIQFMDEGIKDGTFDMQDLLNEFGRVPATFDPATGEVIRMGDAAIDAGSDLATMRSEMISAETAADGLGAAGAAAGASLAQGLKQGFVSNWQDFMDAYGGALEQIRDHLPGSEPRDTSSPLHGLADRGAAIVKNLATGIDEAGPGLISAVDDLFSAIQERAELFNLGSAFGALGGTAAMMLQRRMLDPLAAQMSELDTLIAGEESDVERITGMIATLTEGLGGQEELVRLSLLPSEQLTEEQRRTLELIQTYQSARGSSLQEQAALEEQRAAAAAEYAEQQERIIRLQEKQEQMRFLEQQFALLDMIAEHGLDAEAILGGMELGIDANLEDLLDAMAEAMAQIIAQAEEQLGVESPSKVFAEIGRRTMEGLALGIQELASLPMAQSAIATQAMISAPMALMSSGASGGAVDNSRTVNIQAGGNTIANDVGLNRFSTMIRTEVERAMRGT